jgi:hypothetical protein
MGNSDGLKRKGVDLSQGRPKRKRDVVHPRAEIETPVSTVNFMDISLSNSRTSICPIRSLNQQRIRFVLLKAMSININIEIFLKKISNIVHGHNQCFLFQISEVGGLVIIIHNRDLTKFGYILERKVEKIKVPLVFWQHFGNYCLNMVTSELFISQCGDLSPFSPKGKVL